MPSHRAIGIVLAGALAAAAAAAAPAQAHPVNPQRAPVRVTAAVPGSLSGAWVRLRVTLPGGTTVALSDMRRASGRTVAFHWNGRRGRRAGGPAAPDGRYLLRVETERGVALATNPESVAIDTRAPMVSVAPPNPTLPAPALPSVSLRVRDRDWGPEYPVRVRAVVHSIAGRPLAAGAWLPARDSLRLPEALTRQDRVGAVMVSVQARDAAGNRASAAPIAVGVPGRARPVRVITRVRTARPVVALTIDDGYEPAAVSSMIGTATRLRAPLTMCLNGTYVRSFDAALRAQLQAATRSGWIQVCSHGYSHAQGSRLSAEGLRRDLTDSIVWDRTAGQTSLPFFRPPYGDVGGSVRAVAGELGYRDIVLWDVDTNDWRHRNGATTRAHVRSHAGRGSIVLMHAISSSASALPLIIGDLRARGLEPVALGDLLAAGTPVR